VYFLDANTYDPCRFKALASCFSNSFRSFISSGVSLPVTSLGVSFWDNSSLMLIFWVTHISIACEGRFANTYNSIALSNCLWFTKNWAHRASVWGDVSWPRSWFKYHNHYHTITSTSYMIGTFIFLSEGLLRLNWVTRVYNMNEFYPRGAEGLSLGAKMDIASSPPL